MADPFIGEIRMFAGGVIPPGFAPCDGRLLEITDHAALFALLGTIYGGDGRTNFALPDLRGRVPVHAGQAPGLSRRAVGQSGGTERVVLSERQSSHQHPLRASDNPADFHIPVTCFLAQSDGTLYAPDDILSDAPRAQMHPNAVSRTGGGSGGDAEPHDNVMPFGCVNFIIALFGVFPPRS